MSVRELTVDVVRSFQRNGLANLASAMAFQVVLGLVPFLLFLLALIGFLNLEEIWRTDVAPELSKSVSDAAFRLIDDTVEQVVSRKQLWWLTAGLLLTLWELSAATRVAMTAMGTCAIAALAIVRFAPLLTGDVAGVLAVVSFLVRFGSATRQPLPWVSLGTSLVLAAWILASIGFGLYATYVASYESVFGHLATLFILLVYVYLVANAFLAGIQLDANVRERA